MDTQARATFWRLLDEYWRQGATVAQAIQAAKEAAYGVHRAD